MPIQQLTLIQRTKNRVVADGPRMMRLPLGLGRGLEIEIDLRNWTKLYLGLYEIELNRHIRRLVPPGASSFDVGGQNGYDALVFGKLSGAPVVSFECEADLCQAMVRSFAANGPLEPLMQVRQGFVSDRTDPNEGLVALDGVAFGPGGFVPDFIKMDIEGAEADALEGARRILAERKPNLLIEVHGADIERRCVEILREHGYQPTVVNPRSWIKDNRPISHNRWLIAEGRTTPPPPAHLITSHESFESCRQP